MGQILSCCETFDIQEPIIGIATAIDLDLDNDFKSKKKSKEADLMNIACEINIFNEKQKSSKKSIDELLNYIKKYETNVNEPFGDDENNLSKNCNLNFPRLVVVGTQSSGKSSLVNRIINIDLLPTGNNMVTRTPIYIELKNCETNEIPCINLSYVKDGVESLFYTEKLAFIKKQDIVDKINELSFFVTGNEFSITSNPIIIRIHQINVIPLFIIDLPGLVTIAKTEKGQKESIITDIQNLVKEQLRVQNTYCICAIQSKMDLETDIGLAVVKEIQKEKPELKVFSVLTKPDLIDKRYKKDFDEKIGGNLMEKSISTEMGFYVINNLQSDKSGWYENFFGKKSKILSSKKFGVVNLVTNCKKNIISGIFSEFSNVKNVLTNKKNKLINLCPQLRDGIKLNHEKQLFIDINLYIINKMISDSIDSVGNNYNIGPEIKNLIIESWKDIDNLDPFSEGNMTTTELKLILKNFNGFSRSNQSKMALIVIRCLENNEKMPVGNILKKIKYVTENIKKIIFDFVSNICIILLSEPQQNKLNKLNKYSFGIKDFPKLTDFIFTSINDILNKYENEVIELVNKSLVIHEPSRNLGANEKSYNTNIISLNKELKNKKYFGDVKIGDNESKYEDEDEKNEIEYNENLNLSNSIKRLSVSGTTTGIFIENMDRIEDELSIEETRKMLILSFKQIRKIAKENAMKEIETIQIKKFKDNFIYEMMDKFKDYYKKYELDNLFVESEDMFERNKLCLEYINDIDKILKLINNFEK